MKLERGVAVGLCVETMFSLCGHRSCSGTGGATGGRNSRVCSDVGGGARGRIAREQGIRITGGSGCGGWIGSRIVCGRSGGNLQTVMGTVVGGWLGVWIVCGRCVGCGACGLQLLATTVSVSLLSSSSTRIWKRLLCRVRRWCTMGDCWLVFGAMIVLEIVATFTATATFGGVAGTALRDVGLGGGALGWPDIMVVS
jgi:hypothetical protein